MLDSDKLEQSALAGYPIHPSAVLELIERLKAAEHDLNLLKPNPLCDVGCMLSCSMEGKARLEAAEKDAKTWEESAQSLATQDNKLIEEMTQQAIEAEEAITELEQKIAEQAAVLEKLMETFEKLACLGNGDRHGNSTGNLIAITALAIPTDSKQILAEWLDKQRNEVLEEAAIHCDLQIDEPECPERAAYCAEAIRNLKKPEIK